MIEFCQYSHDKVQIDHEIGDSSYSAVVDISEFEEALDTLLDGYLLDDWLRETMKSKVESYFDRTPNMTDEELQRFIEILEDML